MEATEIPKLVTIAALVGGLEEKIEQMGYQRITVSDHMNGLSYTADNKSDNFIIDMESLAAKDVPANSRIARSLSRKWSNRCSDEKVIQNGNANEKKNENDLLLPSPSPRAGGQGVVTVPEKSIVGTTADQHCSNQQTHHQITITAITTTTNKGTTMGESRCARRNSFRRSSSSATSWILDPKRILYIFATLSSIGTILLIYFTLSIGETVLDSEQ